MPVIMIEWLSGRTKEQKAQMAKAVTDAMVDIGKTAADGVHIVFHDVPKENWSAGGVLYSEKG